MAKDLHLKSPPQRCSGRIWLLRNMYIHMFVSMLMYVGTCTYIWIIPEYTHYRSVSLYPILRATQLRVLIISCELPITIMYMYVHVAQSPCFVDEMRAARTLTSPSVEESFAALSSFSFSCSGHGGRMKKSVS